MRRVTVFLFLLLTAYCVVSAPTPNVTEGTGSKMFTEDTFMSEPRGRGTFGIIFSCTVTFAFCVWTAIHPDIVTNATSGNRILYKIIFTIISVIVPEGLVIMAFGQWLEARRIKKAWREAKHIPPEKKDALGMECAYFVVMGGFIIDRFPAGMPESKPERSFPQFWKTEQKEDRSKVFTATLTPRGFRAYLKDGSIHHETFDPRAITDKSKANYLGKVLAMTQALWLIVQCIARTAAGLSLTLLEIHVAIQVVCTAVIYFFWWSKPLNVEEPIQIRIKKINTDQRLNPLSTLDSAEDELEYSQTYSRNRRYITQKPPTGYIGIIATALFDIAQYIGNGGGEEDKEACSIDNSKRVGTKGDLVREPSETKREESSSANPETSQIVNRDVSDQSEEIRESVAKADIRIESIKKTGEPNSDQMGSSGASFAEEKKQDQLYSILAEGALVIIIGGLHALAWNMNFPSTIERNLWRASSVGMCFFPVALVFIAASTNYQNDLIKSLWGKRTLVWPIHRQNIIEELWGVVSSAPILMHEMCINRSRHKDGTYSLSKHIVQACSLSACLFCLAAYSICIQYITVEAYISIRRPSLDAFTTPRWTDVWPHL